MTLRYECVDCGGRIESAAAVYLCPRCSASPRGDGFRRGVLSVIADPPSGLRRGQAVDPLSFLPIPVRGRDGYPVGNTPLASPRRLRERHGFPRLFLKLDGLNPSGSLKDRASLLVAEQAVLLGERRVALASTGNAGAAMAAAGAAYGLEVVLFVPASAPKAKLLQSLLCGALVVPVLGTYDDAFALSLEYTAAHGGINRNTAHNPLTIEGKKTVSLEIYNQLGGEVPDVVYVPVGDGVILAGVHKGFSDLVKAGAADRMPALVAVQAEGSNALARSFREGREVSLEGTSTVADSLRVSSPVNGRLALRSIRESGGRAVEVDDAAIGAAQKELCMEAGAFVEPSSAAAWAGFLKDRDNVPRGARVAVLLTGTGFKDVKAAEGLVRMPEPCRPALDAAVELLRKAYP